MRERKVKRTCLLFGEGGREKIFFNFLTQSNKFKTLFSHWTTQHDSAWGCSCRDVLIKCLGAIHDREYDLVLCFIDTDKLLSDFPKTHDKEKQDLEAIAKGKVIIVWQDKNHEDELNRATKGKIKRKNGMKGKLNRHSNIVINSTFVKGIFKHFRDNEKP